jgi:UDP-2-acetamido-2-deoxy-ribo-hexuluronate aminotransferase
MEFVDLKTQQTRIKKQLDANIQRVLEHGHYIMGPEIKELETKLAAYVGVKHAIGCASGTDALLMALMALNIGPGDAVFTTPFTFIATAEVISLLGATPVFVDIDPKTYNIDPAKLDLAIQAVKTNDQSIHPLPLTPNSSRLTPKAIIPVDLFGLPADYDAIDVIANKHNLSAIEDAAQSFGAEYKGKKSCSFGHIACTSFFPAKPLGCYGDGGMCFTEDDALAAQLDSIRAHGKGSHKYDNARIGINGRLDTLQAAILLAKFDISPEEVVLRNQVATRYTSLLTGKSGDTIPNSGEFGSCPQISTPYIPSGYSSAWAQYSILAETKNSGLRSWINSRRQASLQPSTTPSHFTCRRPSHPLVMLRARSPSAKTPQTASSACPCTRISRKLINNRSSAHWRENEKERSHQASHKEWRIPDTSRSPTHHLSKGRIQNTGAAPY